MTWSLYRWIWQLESPLSIGMPPAGNVNRCRLYVPARAVWGAVTAEVARTSTGNNPTDYNSVGNELRENVRFTYLFPAECDGKDWRAWLPGYRPVKGLVWRCKELNKELPDRQFRMLLLSTHPSTAIDPSSDAATEGSLRETEVINPRWRDHNGKDQGPVAVAGYVFVRKELQENWWQSVNQLETITIGGDSRYGLGGLRRVVWEEASDVFGYKAELTTSDPCVTADCALSHAHKDTAGASESVLGELELLRGWNYKEKWQTDRPLWVPGTTFTADFRWKIDTDGLWCLA